MGRALHIAGRVAWCGGVGLVALSLVLWIASYWMVSYFGARNMGVIGVGVSHGQVQFNLCDWRVAAPGFRCGRFEGLTTDLSLPQMTDQSGLGSTRLFIVRAPLWMVVVLGGMLALGGRGGIWWQSRRAARGHCPKCGYDLAGLKSGTRCPECGTQARTESA